MNTITTGPLLLFAARKEHSTVTVRFAVGMRVRASSGWLAADANNAGNRTTIRNVRSRFPVVRFADSRDFVRENGAASLGIQSVALIRPRTKAVAFLCL